MEEQEKFAFLGDDRLCRTCCRSAWFYEEGKIAVVCLAGQMNKVVRKMRELSSECASWKRGEERMTFIDFKKLTEEELRRELEKVRQGRVSVGKKRRTECRERRQKSAKKEKEYIDL